MQITGFKSIGALIASFAMYMLNVVNVAIVVLVFFDVVGYDNRGYVVILDKEQQPISNLLKEGKE
ncbi:hypothetical protein GCM10011384_12630 [Psychrobacillus lasiicapitis]|nr:hypothetical protein GCM10011384_12630 [Psychrobacillus lasiicapitis]